MWAGDLQPAIAFKHARQDLATIVLSHNPDSKVMLRMYPWELMLSGHTHGGQVVVPGLGISPAPVWDRGYISGLKRWQGRWIHISRGVGSISGVRFNCRPEVTLLRLIGE
jgi:predicted MPP superfamily phosphohydrolase